MAIDQRNLVPTSISSIKTSHFVNPQSTIETSTTLQWYQLQFLSLLTKILFQSSLIGTTMAFRDLKFFQ